MIYDLINKCNFFILTEYLYFCLLREPVKILIKVWQKNGVNRSINGGCQVNHFKQLRLSALFF